MAYERVLRGFPAVGVSSQSSFFYKAKFLLSSASFLISLVLVDVPFAATAEKPSPDISFDPPVFNQGLVKIEADLFKETAYFEGKLEESGAFFVDAGFQAFLDGLVNEKGIGLRPGMSAPKVRVVKDPGFNAFATPTGNIYLNTGLLADLDNVDELRFVLSHELMHIIGKDSVELTRDLKGKTTAMQLFSMALIPAATAINIYTEFEYSKLIGIYGDLAGTTAQVVYVASVQGYGRGHETRADLYAATTLKKDDRDLQAIVDFFVDWNKRDEKYEGKQSTYFYSSHECAKDRKKRIEEFIKQNGNGTKRSEEPYSEIAVPVILENVRLNVRLGRPEHALDGVTKLLSLRAENEEAHFLKGECYRLMSEDRTILREELSRKNWREIEKANKDDQRMSWRNAAEACYERATQLNPDYAAPHRGKAMLLEGAGQYTLAGESYAKYLELKPDAKDKRFVKAKIEQMKTKANQPAKEKK